jgi:hypothetical protein
MPGPVCSNVDTKVGVSCFILLVDLVEWPRIRKTRVPNFVDNLHGLNIVLARWSSHHRFDCSCPYTILVLLCDRPIIPREELPRPSTLAAQTGCPNLSSCQHFIYQFSQLPETVPQYKQHASSPPSPLSTSNDPMHAPSHGPRYLPNASYPAFHSHKSGSHDQD